MEQPKILVIVPAYNESGNIGKAVEEIRSGGVAVDILVVNDGSADDTAAQAARTGAFCITLPYNLGIGGAVQTGFLFALKKGYDIAIQMDGDGQHNVAYLPKLLEPILKGEADVSIGTRFREPFVGYRSSLIRRMGIHFFAYLITFLIRIEITDPTSGFRAFNRRAIKVFAHEYPHDYPEPEAIVVADRRGLKVGEVPVEMRKRAHGISSIRYLRTLYYMIKVTFAILINMLRQKRTVDEC